MSETQAANAAESEEIVIPEASLEDLYATYEQSEGEFEYIVGEKEKARKYRARRLPNLSVKMALTEAADALCKLTETPKACPESWRPYIKKPLNKKVAIAIIFADRLVVSPRIPEKEGLRMAATCGDLLLDIVAPILNAAEESATAGTYKEITDAKND